MIKTSWCLCALLAVLAPALAAKEELVTLPKRDKVQLTIYNSVDLTLVRETRALTFKKGNNRLQFSWANTLIDPTSVEFRAVTSADKIEVLDTSYPAESHQMLIWTISAESDLSATVEISYFTSGISWAAEYHGMLAADDSSMTLTAYVTVMNNSGEEYEDAQVRLVVGSINLVETIAGLAGGQRQNQRMEEAYGEMRKAARAADADRKKDIVKEGLSEYYIYTVGGTETVPNAWAKRLESFKQAGVPVRSVYTWDTAKYGAQLCRILTFKNDEAHKLGKEPLPAGIVRFYREAGAGRLGYVGAVATNYIAKNDEIKVNAGSDPEVTLKITRSSHKKENLSFAFNGRQQFLQGWDTYDQFKLELKNFRDRAVEFEVNLVFNGDFDFESELAATKVDFRTQRYTLRMDKGARQEVVYKVRTRFGTNARK
ncbi:MAG: DUF4139 domain-containing protein [Planctomycetes bacterium]|nr:DUF4139 domain-containing protein [Planctomycetota bacterium]MCL4729728.1 DUF4139 domain-containing protein [Planctomycetota bacterium]